MKTRFPAGVLAAVLLAAPAAFAQSPRGTAEATVGEATVSIEYGRPSLRGRDMLSQAADGMVWRLGADQSTTLTASHDLSFGDTTVAAGSYSLFAKKSGDAWMLLVNSQTGQWGTEHDSSRDVAEIPLDTTRDGMAEQFTVSIESSGDHGGAFRFAWGETVLTAAFQAE